MIEEGLFIGLECDTWRKRIEERRKTLDWKRKRKMKSIGYEI